MTHSAHGELFPRDEYNSMLEAIDGRLPKRDLVTVSQVAKACWISVTVVYSWIDAGLIEAAPIGATKNYYSIFRKSVIDFYRKRLGLEK